MSPAGQVPVLRRPRPGAGRALPGRPGRGPSTWWEAERANGILNCHAAESSTWLAFTDAEREALSTHDYPALFEMGAHPFLTLTLFIAMFERDYDEPLGFQLEYARKLAHFTLPYADIAT